MSEQDIFGAAVKSYKSLFEHFPSNLMPKVDESKALKDI